MLRLKISKNPTNDAAMIAYVKGSDFSPESGLGLYDTSLDWPENRTGHEKGSIQVVVREDVTPSDLTSANVAIGFQSCKRRELDEPHPLPFAHEISYGVYNPLADPPTDGFLALQILKKDIKVLNYDGTEAQDVLWDLYIPPGGVFGAQPITGGYKWLLLLLIDRETTPDRPLLVKYTGVDEDENILYNTEELISPIPHSSVWFNSTIYGNLSAQGSWTGVLENTNTVDITEATFGDPFHAECIALWTDLSSITWEVSSDDLIIDNGSPIITVSDLSTKSVREVVQEINSYNLDVKATVLLDYPSCIIDDDGPNDITSYPSTTLKLNKRVFAYHYQDTKIKLEPVVNYNNSQEWLPVINFAPFTYIPDSGDLDGYQLQYFLSETTWRTFNSTLTNYIDEVDYPAKLIDKDLIAVGHRNISLSLIKINGVIANDLIKDTDSSAGLIRLTRNVLGSDQITVTYSHFPGWSYTIDYLDLNPNQLHVPEGYKLYFGIFVLPSKVITPDDAEYTIEAPHIGYCIGDSIANIREAVDAYVDPSTEFTGLAKLIGVYQSNSQGELDDITVLDIRTNGGGVKEEITDPEKNAPEAQFFGDIGYYDGKPYPGSGIIIIRGPNRILGIPPVLPETAAPVDGGFMDINGTQDINDIKKRVKRHTKIGSFEVLDLDTGP